MNLADHNYNQYLKKWKSQFSLFAELMNCSMVLISKIKADALTTLAYSSPEENAIFYNQSPENSLTQSVLDGQKELLVSNLQENDTYSNSVEKKAGLKCFYALSIQNNKGNTLGALCMYSKNISFYTNERIAQLTQIKLQLEADIQVAIHDDITEPAIFDDVFNKEDKIKHFLKFSPIGVFFYDTNLVITDLNHKFAEILKSEREVLLGLNMNLIHDKRVLPTLQSAILGVEDEYEGEYITSTSGTSIDVLMKTAPILDSDKKVSGGIGIIQDISIRTHIEKALKTSENQYRELVEKINDVIFSIDTTGVCTYVSPVIQLLIGHSPQEIIGYHFINFIHDNHKITFHDALNKVSQGSTVVSEIKIKDNTGGYRWIRSSMRPVYNEDGLYAGAHGIAQDIEETRLAEISLRESEAQFKLVATHLSDIIYEWNPNTDELIWYGNPNIISTKLNHISTFTELNEIIYKDDQEQIKELWNKAYSDQEAWKSEFRILNPPQKSKYVSGSGILIFKDNKPHKGFGTLTDISNEKKLLENLRLSNLKLEETITKTNGLLSAIPDMMLVFDKNGFITDFHTNDEQTLFKSSINFLNKNILDVLPKEIAELTLEKISGVLHSKQIETYKYKLRINGHKDTFETRMVYLNELHTLAIVRNITQEEKAKLDLIKAKEKAEESDRLKSSFLANMSHEIRTPMNGIIGFSELLSNKTLNPTEREYYTSVIVKSGHQLLEIINDVLEISKIETGQLEVNQSAVKLYQLLESLVDFFKPKAIEKFVELNICVPDELKNTVLLTDEGKLKQILNNLISNSVKFTSNGNINIGFSVVNDSYLEFYVEDNGIGIAKDEQKNIFERFTQANPKITRQHGGTGLGLSISQSLVEMLGGKIWVDSELDKGAKFSFSLPYKKP